MGKSSFRPMVGMMPQDEASDNSPTGATFNSPTVLVGEPGSPFQREVNLQTNSVNTYQMFIWRARNALSIPASISAILADTLLFVGGSAVVTTMYGLIYTGGAQLVAVALLALIAILYISIWSTVLKHCPELQAAFIWRIALICMGAILVIL